MLTKFIRVNIFPDNFLYFPELSFSLILMAKPQPKHWQLQPPVFAWTLSPAPRTDSPMLMADCSFILQTRLSFHCCSSPGREISRVRDR